MTTEAQRKRYARRRWAAETIGATVTPETAHEPMPEHGPGACNGVMRNLCPELATAHHLMPANLCPCGQYRIGDCAPQGWGEQG